MLPFPNMISSDGRLYCQLAVITSSESFNRRDRYGIPDFDLSNRSIYKTVNSILYFSVIQKNSAKMSLPISKKSKDEANKEECNIDISKEAKSILDKILGDVSKTSATKQIIIGTTSGWLTGFVTMKVGKVAAFAVGGGIIMLQIAAHQGYIRINWDKIQRKAEKITDKVEEKVTGEGPKLLDKVERYVDKKLDKAEKLLKNGETRTRRWYHSITGDTTFRPTEFHFFLASFVAGLAIGFATGK